MSLTRDRDRPVLYGEDATREVFVKVERVTAGSPVDGDRPLAAVVGEIGRGVDGGPVQPPEARTPITYYNP